jgi:hypothetical protein
VSTWDDRAQRWIHKIRQSWLGTMIECQEKARRGALPADHPQAVTWVDSDASVTGSAVHQVIEDAVDLLEEHEVVVPVVDLYGMFDEAFDNLLERHQVWSEQGLVWEDRDDENQVVWVKRRRPETARAFGHSCLAKWGNHILPTLSPVACEYGFGNLVLMDEPERLVTVSGTVDYIDRRMGLVDWKTSSRNYEPWEKERWNVQATVYCWAKRQLVLPYADTFTFVVMVDNASPTPQVITVERGPEWDGWLEDQIRSFLPLMEANAPVWPKLDNHALCGPKWCEAWDTCKGARIVSPKWATL